MSDKKVFYIDFRTKINTVDIEIVHFYVGSKVNIESPLSIVDILWQLWYNWYRKCYFTRYSEPNILK